MRLVHGPFGSGKTHALAAFIVEAAERLEAMKSDARILVAAHTNVAVDRLLSALAGKKFHQFVRVGSLRKIDREILPFALHVTSGGASRRAGDRDDEGPIVGESGKALRGKGADHARELRAMLRDGGAEMSAAERAALTREYDAARRGEADRRARALRTIRVVGATTVSCASDALGGCSFAIAVLDECSQMTEPSSVAATARFGVRALVAVGDPQQLPPVLERKSARPEDPLARGLFARLVDAGHAPALLRTQYRLHPALATVPNACFYGNKLVDGCSAEERAALVTVGGGAAEENGGGADGATTTAHAIPMPPLTWIDVKSGGEERDGRSRLSRREAIVAAAAVSRLVELGVAPSDVGVITLYRAQAARVSRELAAARTTSPGKTPPPRRRRSREHGGRVSGPGEGGHRAVAVRGRRRRGRVHVAGARERRPDAREAPSDRPGRLEALGGEIVRRVGKVPRRRASRARRVRRRRGDAHGRAPSRQARQVALGIADSRR